MAPTSHTGLFHPQRSDASLLGWRRWCTGQLFCCPPLQPPVYCHTNVRKQNKNKHAFYYLMSDCWLQTTTVTSSKCHMLEFDIITCDNELVNFSHFSHSSYLAGLSRRRSIPNTTASSPADRKEHGESGSRASWKKKMQISNLQDWISQFSWNVITKGNNLNHFDLFITFPVMVNKRPPCVQLLYVVLLAWCSCSVAWRTAQPLWSDRLERTWLRSSLRCEAGILPVWSAVRKMLK